MIILYTLLLRLSAPLQSWGSGSMFDNRDTDYFPTKSGVIGMIAAAMGRKRDEPVNDLCEMQFGIRIDHQGEIITDFQITDMGKKLNTNISFRKYLSDAVFLAGISSEDRQKLSEIEQALKNPIYSIFLGRRSCPPTMPLVMGVREKALYDALLEEEWLLPEWRKRKEFKRREAVYLRIIIDDDKSGLLIKDLPESFSPFKRRYNYRQYSEKPAKVVHKSNDNLFIEHDPMKELR